MDRYRTTVDLYICSIRALEQRTMAFLIVQSLLAAGYAALLSRYGENPNVTPLLMSGVILIGIAFCFVLYAAGRTVAQDALIWMKCMQSMEGNDKDEPWSCFHQYGSRFSLQRHCLNRPPGPTLWIYSPALFLAAWACAFVALHKFPCWGYIVALLLTAIVVIVAYCQWRTRESQ